MSGMPVIGECTAADLEVLTRVWSLPGAVHEAHWRAQVDGSTTFLVAWQGSVPVGSAVIRWSGFPEANARRVFPGCVEVCHLHVREGYRGRGIGSALVRASESRARAHGVPQIGVGVSDENPRAAALYQRLGYRPMGVVDLSEYDWHDDAGVVHHATERNEAWVKMLPASATE